jgi:hypothetical protein
MEKKWDFKDVEEYFDQDDPVELVPCPSPILDLDAKV